MTPTRLVPLLAALLCPATVVAQQADPPVYFGDLHVHTRLSFDARLKGGTMTGPAAACTYARDVSGLDFVGLADHSEGFGDPTWNTVVVPTVNSYNDELDAEIDGTGRFVTLIGYEWTSMKHGHRNVFFRTEAVPPILYDSLNTAQVEDSSTPSLLWTLLDAWKAQAPTGADYISIPHTTVKVMDWSPDSVDRLRQPVVEVFSKHGNSQGDPDYLAPTEFNPKTTWEAGLNRWLIGRNPGYQVGAIASSDTHDGEAAGTLPAVEQLNFGPAQKGGWSTTGGLVAVHASQLTRAAIFDALRERRCYATSGPRIRLWFSVQADQAAPSFMGSEVQFQQQLTFRVRALGDSAPITSIVILRGEVGGDVTLRPQPVAYLTPGVDGRAVWTDPSPPASHAYYYAIAFQEPTTDYVYGSQTAQVVERAWSSPIWAVRSGN